MSIGHVERYVIQANMLEATVMYLFNASRKTVYIVLIGALVLSVLFGLAALGMFTDKQKGQSDAGGASLSDGDRVKDLAREIEFIRGNQEQLAATLKSLAQIVEALRGPDSLTRTTINSNNRMAPPKLDGNVSVTDSVNPSDEITEEKWMKQRQQQYDEEVLRWTTLVESTFTQEKSNADDSISAGAGMKKAMQNYASRIGIDIESVECRETLCISELTFPPGEDVDRFTFAVAADLQWTSSLRYRVLETNPNGSTDIKFYLTRHGHIFPIEKRS